MLTLLFLMESACSQPINMTVKLIDSSKLSLGVNLCVYVFFFGHL